MRNRVRAAPGETGHKNAVLSYAVAQPAERLVLLALVDEEAKDCMQTLSVKEQARSDRPVG
jgi:hypothetical protein